MARPWAPDHSVAGTTMGRPDRPPLRPLTGRTVRHSPGKNLIAEALTDTRVVTLNGARQAGKSTLARLAAQASPDAVIRLLDDPATLRAARDDPAGFVEHDGLMVIDEVQLAPRNIPLDQGSRWHRPSARPVPAHRISAGAGAPPDCEKLEACFPLRVRCDRRDLG